MTEPRVYTVPQLAAALQISRCMAYRLVKSTGFPTLRVGARILVPRAQLEAWIDAQTGAQATPNALKPIPGISSWGN